MSFTIWRVELSSPPGVSICRISSGAPSAAALCSPRAMKSTLAGPIAPFSRSSGADAVTATGEDCSGCGACAETSVAISTSSSTAILLRPAPRMIFRTMLFVPILKASHPDPGSCHVHHHASVAPNRQTLWIEHPESPGGDLVMAGRELRADPGILD